MNVRTIIRFIDKETKYVIHPEPGFIECRVGFEFQARYDRYKVMSVERTLSVEYELEEYKDETICICEELR